MAASNGVNSLHRFHYTIAALTLAFMVLGTAVFWNIDVFDLPELNIIGVEQNELGEVVIAVLSVIPAFVVDRVAGRQRKHDVQLQAERLRVLRVTMRTVQDIVTNNLTQLQLLRLEAAGHVSDETLTLFDEALKATASQLTALGNMVVFAEKPTASGPGLDVGE